MLPSTSCQRNFTEVFGREAHVVARSPGRVNLIGEHVDYQLGWVMPFAVDRYIECAAAALVESEIRIWSSSIGGAPLRIALNDLRALNGSDSWANYVIGVVAKYAEAGVEVTGFEAVIDGNLPLGAG
ncbi:MAG: galactokinase family protein, partial [Verrucomicrobiales bacterium]